MLDLVVAKVKFWLKAAEGLKQADGPKAPRSGRGSIEWVAFVGVLGVSSTESSAACSVSSVSLSSMSSLADLWWASSNFALLLRVLSREPGLSGLDLLLDNLVLPGGGEVEGFPSKEESWRGGKLVRGTYDHGEEDPLGLTKRTKSVDPYLTLVLCLISPFRKECSMSRMA